MKDILIIVSTFQRRDLTGITLDSIQRCKSAASDVLILDDNSTHFDISFLRRWGWPVERREANVGVGKAALCRYTRFLESPENYRYLCAVDNDLIFGAMFDYRLRQMWELAKVDGLLTVLAGYRSNTQKVFEDHVDWITVDGVGGAIHFVDRETAAKIVGLMPSTWWGMNWDHCISKIYERKLAPKRSLAQHLGTYGDGVNGMSDDRAFDFVGENQW